MSIKLGEISRSIFTRLTLLVLAMAGADAAFSNSVEDISFSSLPGDKFEVRLTFSEAPPTPEDYAIQDPARIVVDFPGVDSLLTENRYPLSLSNAQSAMVLAADNRTRVILNLDQLAAYDMRAEGNAYVIEVGQTAVATADDTAAGTASTPAATSSQTPAFAAGSGITNIDFRRGEQGEGRIIVTLSNPSINIDMQEVRGAIELSFSGASLPQNLANRYDVVDFATPVRYVDAQNQRNGALLRVETTGDEYDYLAYQTDRDYVVSIKPLTEREAEERAKQFEYVGERISLNFQDIAVKSVLQIIADMTDLNLVTSDTVTGSIALRLENVPWDQALELILKTKGLDKRQVGNVLMVAPAAEIAERERQELETQQQLEELAPLRTEYIRVRYANATDIFNLFGQSGGQGGTGGASGGQQGGSGSQVSILSERGTAIVDERTNSIILTDTQEKIDAFRDLIEQIDIPIRQVMIEARIVIANTDFREDIGVRWGGIGNRLTRNSSTSFSGSIEGLDSDPGTPRQVLNPTPEDLEDDVATDLIEDMIVDLGVPNPAGSFAIDVVRDNIFLDLELSALQDSGDAEIVSQPKIITGDKQEAEILSGTEVPYQEASASGATTTSFQEAVLKLNVTPQITPDNNIIMDLDISQDSIGSVNVGEAPTIDVTQIQTQVLVPNGETVVLGGIYQTERQDGVTKVPLLGDIPYVGNLFKNTVHRESKRELLIFITPRILTDTFER